MIHSFDGILCRLVICYTIKGMLKGRAIYLGDVGVSRRCVY